MPKLSIKGKTRGVKPSTMHAINRLTGTTTRIPRRQIRIKRRPATTNPDITA
jgi:hypothetical protein